MPKTNAIFDDNYVRKLEDYCKGDLGVPGEVHWLGRGGIRTDVKNQALYREGFFLSSVKYRVVKVEYQVKTVEYRVELVEYRVKIVEY